MNGVSEGASRTQIQVATAGRTKHDLPKSIDTIRALACLCVVAYHVVGGPHTGLQLPPRSAWHPLLDLGGLFRMPAFAMISGLVYQQNRFNRANVVRALPKRLIRLGIPFIVCTLATLMLRHLFRGDQTRLQALCYTHISTCGIYRQ